MLYLIAIFLPWLSLFLVGKVVQAAISLVLYIVSIVLVVTVLFSWLGFLLFIALAIHALLVIHSTRADRRTERLVEAMSKDTAAPASSDD